MQYLCNRHGLDRFYPTDPGERAMVDSAMFYLIGTLYPLITRATYPALGFPQYPGEIGSSDADDDLKTKAQSGGRGGDRRAARGLPVVLPRRASVHRWHHAVDRRHPVGGVARVPAGDRLRVPLVGRGLYDRDRGDARRGVHRARPGRPRLHRLRQVAGLSRRQLRQQTPRAGRRAGARSRAARRARRS